MVLKYFPKLLLVSMFIGCTKTVMQINKEGSQANVSALQSSTDISTSVSEPCFSLLLLHGLGASADELQKFAEKIADTFGNAALILLPTCRVGWNSIRKSTKYQAKMLFQYLEAEFAKHSKQVVTFPLIIIGYSHGGVLACILGNNYKNRLNIYGIVTLNAPLTGTPVLERRHGDIQKFITNAHGGLQLIADSPSQFGTFWRLQMRFYGYALPWLLSRWSPLAHAAKDIVPNSVCMQKVYSFLRNGSHRIPCFLISGYQNDFKELFCNKIKQHDGKVLALNNAYAALVAGDKEELHDTLIPLRSQLCRGPSFQNLTTLDRDGLSVMSMPGQPHIKGHIYENITHAGNLIVLDDHLYPYGGESVLYSKRVFTDLVVFIKEQVAGLEGLNQFNKHVA